MRLFMIKITRLSNYQCDCRVLNGRIFDDVPSTFIKQRMAFKTKNLSLSD